MEINLEKIEQDTPKIYVKVDPTWYCVKHYLMLLTHFGSHHDEEFARCFDALMRYVDSKLEMPINGDIIDDYIIFEIAMPTR